MAQLRNLGQPFGSPGGIINVPAPSGSALAGQIQMQSMQGLGQALGAYLGQRKQNQLWQQDQSALQNFFQSYMASQQPGFTGPPMPFPEMQSRRGQGIEQSVLQSQLGGIFGDPFGVQRSKAGLQEAQTEQALRPDLADPFTLTPGGRRYDASGNLIAEAPDAPKTTQASSVIVDPKNSDRAIRVRDTFDEQGNVINRQILGEATLAEKLGGVAPEAFTHLQKSVAAKIQTEIKDAEVNIANLKSISKQFKPEYTELPFKISQKWTTYQEKAGGLLGKPNKARQESLSEFTGWRRNAAREFVVFKKWATGVAAGQKEMTEQIEQAFAAPLRDSATEFKSKIDGATKVQERTLAILTDILNRGTIVTIEDKRNAERSGLRQALSEELNRRQSSNIGGLTPEQQSRREELRKKAGL